MTVVRAEQRLRKRLRPPAETPRARAERVLASTAWGDRSNWVVHSGFAILAVAATRSRGWRLGASFGTFVGAVAGAAGLEILRRRRGSTPAAQIGIAWLPVLGGVAARRLWAGVDDTEARNYLGNWTADVAFGLAYEAGLTAPAWATAGVVPVFAASSMLARRRGETAAVGGSADAAAGWIAGAALAVLVRRTAGELEERSRLAVLRGERLAASREQRRQLESLTADVLPILDTVAEPDTRITQSTVSQVDSTVRRLRRRLDSGGSAGYAQPGRLDDVAHELADVLSTDALRVEVTASSPATDVRSRHLAAMRDALCAAVDDIAAAAGAAGGGKVVVRLTVEDDELVARVRDYMRDRVDTARIQPAVDSVGGRVAHEATAGGGVRLQIAIPVRQGSRPSARPMPSS